MSDLRPDSEMPTNSANLANEAQPASRGAVLITGASTGIGRASALYLDQLGFRVLAAVRRESDAHALIERASPRLTPVLLDVTEPASIATAARQIEALAPEDLVGLVNNAGIAVTGPLEFIDLDRVRRQFEVNFFGQLAVTQAMLPALRKQRGRILNMSSMSGRVSAPFYGPYSASKHALEAASDALRGELAPWGIRVILIEPGAIDTPIWEKGRDLGVEMLEDLPAPARQLYGDVLDAGFASIEMQGKRGIPVERVAHVVAQALMTKRPRARYVVGRDAQLSILSRRLLPDRVYDRLLWLRMNLPGRDAYIR